MSPKEVVCQPLCQSFVAVTTLVSTSYRSSKDKMLARGTGGGGCCTSMGTPWGGGRLGAGAEDTLRPRTYEGIYPVPPVPVQHYYYYLYCKYLHYIYRGFWAWNWTGTGLELEPPLIAPCCMISPNMAPDDHPHDPRQRHRSHPRSARWDPCIDTGVTYIRRVGGSGAPGTPPPLGKSRAKTLSILFPPILNDNWNYRSL